MMMQSGPTDIAVQVGSVLKGERERRGWSLDEAAALANLSPEHLKEVEDGFPKPGGGRRQGPTLIKLERIANVYGLTIRLVSE